jgi:hypothetical protein
VNSNTTSATAPVLSALTVVGGLMFFASAVNFLFPSRVGSTGFEAIRQERRLKAREASLAERGRVLTQRDNVVGKIGIFALTVPEALRLLSSQRWAAVSASKVTVDGPSPSAGNVLGGLPSGASGAVLVGSDWYQDQKK